MSQLCLGLKKVGHFLEAEYSEKLEVLQMYLIGICQDSAVDITLRLNIQRECRVIIVETIIAQDLLARPILKGLMKYPNNFCAPNVIIKQCPKVVLKGTLTEYTQRNSTSLVSLVGKFLKT